ncbi:MAG: RIP metalloprotease RseP [Chloroflexi bacterium RBG_13_57_8]|nr:MAG: RIP metalloprotease RseP [Chloroflexi bacterium RBG_13_57_8]
MILTIVIGVIVLSVLILVHELGHFFSAKATGVPVEEFGIGFPPRIWGKKWRGTIYSINWIPFGGFNKIAGEIDPQVPKGLASRGYWVRLLVLSGGIIMNLLLPFVLISIAYMVPHNVIDGKVQVEKVAAGSPAEMAGIRPGDHIVSVNGKPVKSLGDLSRDVQLHLGAEMDVTVIHSDGATETVTLVPRWRPPPGQGAMGTQSTLLDARIVSESLPFWRAIPTGVRQCIEALALYKNGIIGMIIGTVPFIPTGPVGIVQVAGEVARSGISPVLELTAFISIAIAITQIIPFPALDGGRIIFVLVEWARRGKRVSPKIEGIVHTIGFVVLLALLLLITYQDIFRWSTGGSLIP